MIEFTVILINNLSVEIKNHLKSYLSAEYYFLVTDEFWGGQFNLSLQN